MKVAEAVAKFLESQGVTHVFGLNGGANLHLIHGIYDVTKIKFISNAEEKNAAYAADAFARINGLGVCLVTSGPGAAGVVGGICSSYQDSTPILFIAGNVATFRQGARFGVRAYGFQELDFVRMISGVTKYAVQPETPHDVVPFIEYAVRVAREGRRGPVVVSIPDDTQRMEV